MKTCVECKIVLENSKFEGNRKKCIRCRNASRKEYKKEWIQKNRERIRQVVHENYLKNREKVLARTKKWRLENKEKFYEMWKKSAEKEPHKRSARKLLNRAIETGKITKPNECNMCGKQVKLEAHHSDYAKPLEVQWYCRPCHAYIHRQFKL